MPSKFNETTVTNPAQITISRLIFFTMFTNCNENLNDIGTFLYTQRQQKVTTKSIVLAGAKLDTFCLKDWCFQSFQILYTYYIYCWNCPYRVFKG